MTRRNKLDLRGLFETDDVLLESSFVDLIDSLDLSPTTIVGLKSITGEAGQAIRTLGYYALGDCEELIYFWNAVSTATDDGVDALHPGLIVQPTGVVGAGRWIATPSKHVNARWFGASPVNGDNKPYLQRCVDVVVGSDTLPHHIYIPGGIYNCASGILFKRDTNGDKVSEFFSITVEGSGEFPYGLAFRTKLNFTHNDTFGLAFQTGKGIRVKNIELAGVNTFSFASPRLAYTSAESGYVVNGCRDNGNSPYAGIVIDPFGSAAGTAEANRYPGYSAEYPAGQGGGGTTDVKIEDCRIAGFVCNVMVTPNGNTQNAEQMEFVRIRTEQCKVCFAIGQLQSRSITIRDFTSWGNVLYFVNTSMYGGGSGQPPYITGGNMAGHMKYFMYSTGSSVATTRIENLFMESVYSIGRIDIDLLTFDGCILKWGIPDASFTVPMSFLSANKRVNFDGCFLLHSANPPTSKSIQFQVGQLSFKDCVFDVLPTNYSSFDQYTLKDCKTRHWNSAASGSGVTTSTGESLYANPEVNIAGAVLGWNQSVVFPVSNRVARNISLMMNRENLESGTVLLTVDSSTGTGSFTSLNGSLWNPAIRGPVGIHILNFINDEFGSPNYITGFVSGVSGNTVSVAGLPPQVVTGTYTIYSLMPFRYHHPMIGDTTAGSNVITNVKIGAPSTSITINYRVGETIRGVGLPVGTYVTARDNAAATITLSQNAAATAVNVDLYDADLEWTARMATVPTVGSWQKGTLITDSTGATNGWRCTASGTYGTATEPTFVTR